MVTLFTSLSLCLRYGRLLGEFNLSEDSLPALISMDGDDHSFSAYNGQVKAKDIKDWLKNVQTGFRQRTEL